MCDICDGRTLADTLDHTDDIVRRVGWALQAVEPAPGSPGWVYTIGLLTSYDHPELVLVDDDVARAASLLNAAGREVRDGALFEPGDHFDLGRTGVEVVNIHPVHLQAGAMAVWVALHQQGPDDRPPLEAYQLWVDERPPEGSGGSGIRLDSPIPVLGASGLNRAARRSASRSRRRR